MRLPWPFGRSEAAPAETEPKTDDGAGSQAAPLAPGHASGPAADAPPTGAWASLPPIQRATGAPPVVAPARPFLEGVPGHQPLPPIVGQLGHDVTSLAPSGTVAAPVHAVASLTSHAELVDRPVQRRPADVAAGSVPDPSPGHELRSASLATAAAPATVAPAPTEDAAPGTGHAPTPEPAPVAEPVRQLSVVPAGAAAAQPARSLTKAEAWAPPTAADRPLVHRTNVQASARASATPALPEPAHPAAPPAAATAAEPTPAGPTHSDPPTPAPRRAGLGAPLPAAPSTAVPRSRLGSGLPSRPGMPGMLPSPERVSAIAGQSPLYTTVQRRGAAARAAATPAGPGDGADATRPATLDRAGSPAAPYVGSRTAAPLPSLPVVSRQAAAPAATMGDPADAKGVDGDHHSPPSPTTASLPPATRGESGTHHEPAGGPSATIQRASEHATTAAAAVQRSATQATPATPAAPERRPLVGARPLRPSVMHETSAGPAPSGPADASESPPLAPAMPGLPPAAGPAADVVTTQSWTHPAAGVVPSIQRALERTQPTQPTLPGIAAQRSVSALNVTPTSPGQARRDPAPMTLARFAAPAAAQASAVASPAVATVPGLPPGIVAAPPATVVQTLPAAPSSTLIAPTATAVVQREAPAPAPAADEGEGRSEGDLDQLARALFPRFQRQLRMEYVYEREARGLPFDS